MRNDGRGACRAVAVVTVVKIVLTIIGYTLTGKRPALEVEVAETKDIGKISFAKPYLAFYLC